MPISGICQGGLNDELLTPGEKRIIAHQLNELAVLREKVSEYQKAIEQYVGIQASFADTCRQAVDAEQKASSVMIASLKKEIEAERANAEFYRQMYETLLKRKAGIGCWLKRIFTLGIHRCP